MKKHLLILAFLTINIAAFAQIQNGNFDDWYLKNNKELPEKWYCPYLTFTLCPCDKITNSTQDFAVRIHNVMPCVDQGYAKSRAAGFIEDYFSPNQSEFNISFDVSIDSIIEPAAFVFTLRGAGLDSTITWKADELGDFSYSQNVYLNEPYDSLEIQFRSEGYPVEDNLHLCDLGYISGIVDHVKLSEIVSSYEVQQVDVQIFPNPFTDKIQVIVDNNEIPTLQLLDINGQELFYGKSNTIIPNSKLAIGVYILKINTGDSTITKKIVKR